MNPPLLFVRNIWLDGAMTLGGFPMIFILWQKWTLSSAEFLQWKMWLSDEAHEKVRALGQCGNIRPVNYKMLTAQVPGLLNSIRLEIPSPLPSLMNRCCFGRMG
jgi:hypothetical protein